MNTSGAQTRPRKVTAVVIGGGQAGLATSHCLTTRAIDHVVLERGQVANAWRHERWDSLRLLTPNWQSRLPGCYYSGSDPDGFMSAAEVVEFISGYAANLAAPLHTDTRVQRLYPVDGGYRVVTNRGQWQCRCVVVASGAFNRPALPVLATALPPAVHSLTPHQYRNPGQLPKGGVLVVGAAATGIQIADEIQRAGRPVTLAVGEHVRMPRNYRGRDTMWWMHETGMLDECHDQVDDLRRVRALPSPQLIGTPEKVTLDLNTLADRGVELVGRVAGLQGNRLQFSGSLANVVRLADLKLGRLLAAFDQWAELEGSGAALEKVTRPEPTRLPRHPRLEVDLGAGEISTVIWATGFRPDYDWLQVPVLDHKGWIRHRGGVADAPGLYVMGLPFMRKRKSSFLFGCEDDARFVADHIEHYLAGCQAEQGRAVA